MKHIQSWGFMIFILWMTISTVKGQQRTQFTQYLFSGLVINPAYAGSEEALSITLINRHQWRSVEGAPTTQTLALQTPVGRKKVGLGLLISNDKIGVHQNLFVQASMAYHLQVAARAHLSMGLQTGLQHVRSDYASLLGTTSIDPKLSEFRLNEVFIDLGAGIYFRSPRVHLGISSPGWLNQSVQINDTASFKLRNINLFGFAKYKIPLGPIWILEPAILLKHYHMLPLSMDITGALTYKEVLTAGLSFRINESVGYIFRAKVTPQLHVGYAYDYPMGLVSRLGAGSHEFIVHYLFKYERSGIKSPRI
jgi:type IX secretion system PorP/SprF family membrane protein